MIHEQLPFSVEKVIISMATASVCNINLLNISRLTFLL